MFPLVSSYVSLFVSIVKLAVLIGNLSFVRVINFRMPFRYELFYWYLDFNIDVSRRTLFHSMKSYIVANKQTTYLAFCCLYLQKKNKQQDLKIFNTYHINVYNVEVKKCNNKRNKSGS